MILTNNRKAVWLSELCLVLFSAAPCALQAADNGLYFGAALTDVSSDYDWPSGTGTAEDDSGFKGIVGIRPFDWLAVEANYVDFGETAAPLDLLCIPEDPCPYQTAIDARALSVSVVGLWALPLVDLYARAGVARWEADREITPTFGVMAAGESAGTDATYGAGVQLRFASFAVRLEYERFKLASDMTDTVSVGFTYKLL